jgi:hypothetical protein
MVTYMINIFNDWDSRNRGERHAPGKIIFQRRKKSNQVYESSSLKCIQASIRLLTCHNDVIDTRQNNGYLLQAHMDRALLNLSHKQKGYTVRTNM